MENWISIGQGLPTKCRLYAGVDPEQVCVRTLKGRDEKILAELSSSNLEKKFLTLLKNVVRGVDPAELTYGDRDYIMLWLVINSRGENFPVSFTCANCLQPIDNYPVNLAEFEVAELPEDFKEPVTITLTDGAQTALRLFRVKDEIKVDDYKRSGGNTWLYQYAITVVDDKNVVERIAALENMDVRDLDMIKAFHEQHVHGPVMESKYECPKCGGAGLVPVPFRLEMVFPFGAYLKGFAGKGV
jgi:hypothetical protein